MEHEYIEYEFINSIGEWATVGEGVLIDWNETETETEKTNKE